MDDIDPPDEVEELRDTVAREMSELEIPDENVTIYREEHDPFDDEGEYRWVIQTEAKIGFRKYGTEVSLPADLEQMPTVPDIRRQRDDLAYTIASETIEDWQ